MNTLAMQIIQELEEWANLSPCIGEVATDRQKGWVDGNMAARRQLIANLRKFKRTARTE